MRTVKEVSQLTGISVRTLHYYDEIGLFSPTQKTTAGYRLYDDKALETLQQILFFREFDIPLKQIRAVINGPSLDKTQILQLQRNMLAAKKARIERLIASIDDILKGENKMDFTVFTKVEIEEMFDVMYAHMPEEMKRVAVKEFGSLEQWKTHYLDVVSSEKMQKQYEKVIEWYGSKQAYLDVALHPISQKTAEAFKKRIDAIQQKLAEKRGCDVQSFEVKEIIGEYVFVMKRLTQVKDEKQIMLAQARYYTEETPRKSIDGTYGPGTAAFFARAIEAFYQG
ncbi:MAG: MerR family transcriptional regulator [Oscillospiraceae bacterium]|nr:MerR family transcriptional regulator [Oscillospiraceae bacterium]